MNTQRHLRRTPITLGNTYLDTSMAQQGSLTGTRRQNRASQQGQQKQGRNASRHRPHRTLA
jgi:hypothetical protein